MKKHITIGLCLMLLLAASSVFGSGTKPGETSAMPKWLQIKWDQPKPWAERLKGIELADQVPQGFIDQEAWLKDQPKKTIAVGGYVWPEGWEAAVEDVDSISFYNYGGLPHDPAIGIAIAAFEEKTGITINAQAMEELSLWLKTVAAMTAKSGEPQLIHAISLQLLNHIAAAGWAENLDFFWPEEVQKLYGKGIVDAAQSEGHFWASGMVSVKPFVLFYRPSVLKEATGSPEPPKTYQEMLEKAKMVAQKTDKYGLAVPGKDHRYMNYLNAGPLYSMGGKFLQNGKYNVTSSEYKEMFRYMVSLVKEGAVPKEALGWSWTDSTATFENGKAAMLLAGSVNATRFSDDPSEAIKGDWDFDPMVGWKNGPRMTTNDGTVYWSVNVYASEGEKAAAMLFLDFYRSFQSQWNEIGFEGNESAIPEMYNLESINKAVYKPEVRAAAIQNTGGESLPVNGDQMLKFELDWWQKACLGEVSVEEALENLEKDIDTISP